MQNKKNYYLLKEITSVFKMSYKKIEYFVVDEDWYMTLNNKTKDGKSWKVKKITKNQAEKFTALLNSYDNLEKQFNSESEI